MRKIIYVSVFALLFFSVLMPLRRANAFGSFQIVTAGSGATAVLNQTIDIPIQFIYSGDYFPRISLLGSTIPLGMKLQPTLYSGNGFDTVHYYGTPTVAGDYPLILSLTDNNGALLTQKFDFNVINPDLIQVLTKSMPDGYLGRAYSAVVLLHYIGVTTPMVSVSNLPDGMAFSVDSIVSTTTLVKQGDTTVTFSGTPTKAGQYSVKFGMQTSDSVGGMTGKMQVFPVNITDPNINSNSININNFNIPTVNNNVATTSSPAVCDNSHVLNNGKCLTILENCSSIYGGNVVVANNTSSNNCACSSGYTWNGGKTKCVIVIKYAIPKNNINVRTSASNSSKIMGLAKKNSKYEIIDLSNKTWVKVKFSNKIGWLSKSLVTIK